MLCDKLVRPVSLRKNFLRDQSEYILALNGFFIFPLVTFNLLISLGFLTVFPSRILSSSKCCVSSVNFFTFRMRTDSILAPYFFLIAIIALLLTPTYLLGVFELEKINRNRTYGNRLFKLYSLLATFLFQSMS